jgi:hypothetical protein
MRNLISLKNNSSSLEFAEIVVIYKELRTTTICNKVLIASAPTMLKTLPVVSLYYDETTMNNLEWETELDAIVNTLEALSQANTTSIENPLAADSPLNGKVLACATKSTILSTEITKQINNALSNAGLANNVVTVETLQSIDTEEKWNNELDCMRRLVSINFANTNMDTVIDIYDDVREDTILCNSILEASAETIIPQLPIISTYYALANTDNMDWGNELDAIVNAYKLLVNAGLANITNPIATLNGEIIMACMKSVILRTAFKTTFNENLGVLGLAGYYQLTDEKLTEVNTAEKWDNELTAIMAVSEFVANLPYSLVNLNTLKAQIDNTIIAKEILVSVLAVHYPGL